MVFFITKLGRFFTYIIVDKCGFSGGANVGTKIHRIHQLFLPTNI
jgi:hypothetical protein